MEEDFDFEAALRDKGLTDEYGGREAPQGTPSEEVAEEAAPAGRPRDDLGRFAAESQETEEPTEAEKLFAGKYKSVEDLERAYQEAASKLGEQGNELGELRKLIDERLPAVDDEEDWAEPVFTPQAAGQMQNLLEAGRYQEAAVYAAQSGNNLLYDQVLEAWFEEQPRAAANFDTNLKLQAMEARWQQQRQPEVQARVQSEADKAWNNVAKRFSDLPGLADKVIEAGQRYPDVLRVLQTDSGIEGKERAIEALYKIAKADSLDTLSQASQEAAQVAADEARRDKADSVVASASNAKREAPKTNVERFKQAILDAEELSVQSGLTRE